MFVSVGFGNYVNTDQIISICRADSSPMKRMMSEARSNLSAVDATQGRKTKSVIVMMGGQLVLSALLPETIAARCNNSSARDPEKDDEADDGEESDE